MEIVLYQKKYKGIKVMFNSRKGSGTIIEGIAVQEVPELDVVILRDRENFSHAVHVNSVKEII
jgi:hypothetical protein